RRRPCARGSTSPAAWRARIRRRASSGRGHSTRPSSNYNPRMRRSLTTALATLLLPLTLAGQSAPPPITVLKPARVFDGETMHEGWSVRVRGERVEAVGADAGSAAPGATVINLPGTTLMPGMVEGHSHILLHAYNETTWNDQVAHEGLALRVARATNHLRAT